MPRRRAARTATTAPRSSRPRAASATRSGQPEGQAIGSRMSGGDACAMVDPSTNSTMEWITDCGWTTTSMSSYGMSKSRCASMTSRPLLTRVEELVVTIGPMSQVGWAIACAGVTSAVRARAAPERTAAGGKDEPAHLVGAAAAQALGQRGMLGVDRHDLAGLGGRGDHLTPDDQRLLVRQRQGGPGCQRRQGGRSPTAPAMALSTMSARRRPPAPPPPARDDPRKLGSPWW